jgi:hypothetical protein
MRRDGVDSTRLHRNRKYGRVYSRGVRNCDVGAMRLAARNQNTLMKTDNLSFSFVAAIVLAGVIVALTSPAHSLATSPAPVAQAAVHEQIEASFDATPDMSVSE